MNMDNRAKAESQVREYFYNKKQRHDGFYRFGCVGYDHKAMWSSCLLTYVFF